MRAREFIIEDWNKVTPIQELERYANDPTIFISYTVLPKLGINPNPNSSDTPGGVYAYPLSMVYDDIKNDITNVPFYTSSVKYIMVFKYSGKILSTDNFSESDFKSALTRLHGWFGKILHRPNVPFHTDDYDMGEESPFNTLLEYTKTLALKKLKIPPNNIKFSYDSNEKIIPPIVRPAGYVFTWNTLVKKATGYDAFISTKGTIHGGEPIQAMFLSSEKLQVISMITIPKAKKQGVAEDRPIPKAESGKAESGKAVALSNLGKFHAGVDTLGKWVPERLTHQFALDPIKWEHTFYSLTLKEPKKIRYYRPKNVDIVPGTLVGDMAIANQFYRTKDPAEQEKYALAYLASLKPYPVNLDDYKFPELLIPRKEQGVAEGGFDNASPMTKDTVKADRIRSLKNLIAIAKEQERQLRVQELELELKKLQGVAEGTEQSLSSMVSQDQAERNEYANFVKSQAGGDWTKGAKMYAQLKKRSSNNIFGDAARLNQFMTMKFDFDKFTAQDWKNYWTLAQHCDKNRDFQKNALSVIKKYQGEDHINYQYLYDRISCGTTGKQKYGTQDICGKDKQGVAEDSEKVNPLTNAVISFYKPVVDQIEPGPVDDYVKQAKELLNQAPDPTIRSRMLEIFKKGQKDPMIQGGVVTAIAAILTGGLLSSASRMGLSPAQTNILLQAVLNTVIPTIIARINNKSWRDTIKYTLASVGVGMTAAATLSEKRMAEGLSIDVPNEEWLQDKIDYAKSKGRDEWGVPHFGSVTAYVRPNPQVSVVRLKLLKGMRNEQNNVRPANLEWLMAYMEKTGKLPPDPHGNEYAPYVMVAYNGEAWVNEGNHRIMAAYRLGGIDWKKMPVQLAYFDGGERVESDPINKYAGIMYPGKIGLK